MRTWYGASWHGGQLGRRPVDTSSMDGMADRLEAAREDIRELERGDLHGDGLDRLARVLDDMIALMRRRRDELPPSIGRLLDELDETS
jgi:hypothetical protein